jgi:hypothetical protein
LSSTPLQTLTNPLAPVRALQRKSRYDCWRPRALRGVVRYNAPVQVRVMCAGMPAAERVLKNRRRRVKNSTVRVNRVRAVIVPAQRTVYAMR